MANTSRPQSDAARASDEAVMLNAALESMPYGFSIWDNQERLVLSNRRYADIHHLPAGQISKGMLLAEVCELTIAAGNHRDKTPAELLALYRQRLAESARSPEACTFEKAIRGRVIKTTYIREADLGTVIMHEDVTGQRERENELPGKLLTEILESIGAGVCLWDADLRLANWNSAFRNLQVKPDYELTRGARLGEVLDHCVPLRDDPRRRGPRGDGPQAARPRRPHRARPLAQRRPHRLGQR